MTSLIARFAPPIELRSSPASRLIGFGLLGLAALACLMGLSAFSSDQSSRDGWLPYISSTVLIMAACYVLVPYKKPAIAAQRLTLTVGVIALIIVIVAAGFRFYRVDELPAGTWNDEAYIGTIAQTILTDSDYAPIYVIPYSHPLHYYGLVALAFNLVGYGTLAIRLVSGLFGLGAVVAAFFAGREAFGNRFGLILAFLFAISRWHITFSRFGLFTITVPFFVMLTIWLLLRARRTGQLHDFAWAGLAFGYGLNFYIGIRLFIPVVFLYIVIWILSVWWQQRKDKAAPSTDRPLSKLFSGLAVFTVVGLFAVGPLALYAMTHPEEYWSRENQVSIFTTHDDPTLAGAIYNNVAKHLLMFNYRGDANGRHNLSGEPMLDPVTGILFVLGIALAISRLRHPTHSLFLLLFVFCLLGGVLSLDFEAPQANRALGVICAVLYFAALAAETIWRTVENSKLLPDLKHGLMTVAALGIGGYALFFNLDTYFVRQANSQRTWEEFNGIESLAARQMLQVDRETTQIYASVFLNNHEVIRFLAPDINDTKAIIPPVGLPLRDTGDKGAAILVDPNNSWIVEQAHRFYPEAQFTENRSPNGNIALYSINISPEQIQGIQGATVSYWAGDTPEGSPVSTQNVKSVEVDWTTSAPVAQPFVSRWETTLYAPLMGDYELSVQAPASAILWIDEQQFLTMPSGGEQSVVVTLSQGDHALRLDAQGGSGPMSLRWRPPETNGLGNIPPSSLYLSNVVPVQGLLGQYYANDTWAPPAQISRVDAFIDTYFHIIPLPRPFSVDWTGKINIGSDGDWTFGLRIAGKAQVFIDDQLVIDAVEPTESIEGTLNLTAGWHSIRIHYLDYVGASRIHLYWTPPGGEREIVPTWALRPY
jgi:4-amino-4-deoxy-L-arabinose transferase-like glycosyltransferase